MRTPRLIADRYSLVEPLPGAAASSGWGAQDTWSGQSVMITCVSAPGLAGAELLRARHQIADEVRILSGVQHDRLARPLDVVFDADDLWVAAEPVPGETMADELGRRGAVALQKVARWGCDVADGLVAAHSAGVPHRNLHAGMVGLAEDGRAVLGGFATTVVTPDGLRSGTPVHVAPEVAKGTGPSPAADVFALGVMLYTAVEGHGPFPTATDLDQLFVAVAAGAVAAPQRAGRLTDPLMRMLNPDPAGRPTAAAVANQLRQLAAEPGLPPEVTGPSSRSSNRMWWIVAAAVVLVLTLTGSLLAAFGLPQTPDRPGQPAAAPASPPSPIGDPRTADPCSLVTVSSVQRFGQTKMFGDFGYPQSCLIAIDSGGKGYVNLIAALDSLSEQQPSGVAERVGDLTIYREAASDDSCSRTVVLADQSAVHVLAQAYEGATMDLCAVADTGTQTAIVTLSSGGLPRREISAPPNALTRLDTCTLLDQAALRQVPGLDASQRHRGFAGWLCVWGDDPAFVGEPRVTVAVNRENPLEGQPVEIGGRSGLVTPGDSGHPGTCYARLVQRSYTGTSGEPRVELLHFTVFLGAQQPSDAACQSAKALAAAAAPKLPPPS